jgi:hypothetical protein
MHIYVSLPLARALVPGSIAVTGGPVMVSPTVAFAPTPRGTGTRARTRIRSSRRPGACARFEPLCAGFRLEEISNARIHHRLPPTSPMFPLLFPVRSTTSIGTVRGSKRRGVNGKRWLHPRRLTILRLGLRHGRWVISTCSGHLYLPRWETAILALS